MTRKPAHFGHPGRTPLFETLRSSLDLARLANQRGAPPVDELVEMHATGSDISRRQFMKSSAAAAFAVVSGGLLRNFPVPPKDTLPSIAVVGAGMAGLNAAYKLSRAGLRSTVYEASGRPGGRIYTARDAVGAGLTTEMGGEFIDSIHTDMLGLVQLLGLKLVDLRAGVSDLIRETYFFGLTHRTVAEVVEAFQPVAAQMQADLDTLGDLVDFEHEGGATTLDNTSIAQYLDQVGASGWFRQLLDVAYVTEYGAESDQQSSLNLLYLISTDISEGQFEVFGASDERYSIKGGNQQVVDALARMLEDQIRYEHRLEAIESKGMGYTLTFAGPNGSATEVAADIVILCIPFTILRQVDMRVYLPDFKRKAINELGYGTSAKVVVGFKHPIWRQQGYGGNIFTDEIFQSSWDSTIGQELPEAGLTLFLGGQRGLESGQGTANEQANHLMGGVEHALPGANAARNGKVARFHWPSYPWAQGGYACYKPGQWTTIAGAEIKPLDNLFFAGEHCSYDFQGYMNGAAESGRRAATAVMHAIQHARRRLP